jgi:hypothetical protein
MRGRRGAPRPKPDIEPVYGTFEPGMLLADLHVHTKRSDGWWEPGPLAEAALEAGLSAIAITDHDDIRGGFDLADYCERRNLSLRVLAGCEVSARSGASDVHIIGLDLFDEIRPWQSVRHTVDDILAQGGLPVMPHPKPDGRGFPAFGEILGLGTPVAVEVYNSAIEDFGWYHRRRSGIDVNAEAVRFYEEHRDRLLGAVGGTDAHFRSVGRGLTGYEGDILEAIRERRTVVIRIREGERMRPWDPLNYFAGLKRMARRRAAKWGPRP